MDVINLMKYLGENIPDSDRKLFNKLAGHANKRYQKNLIILLKKYKVERKKFIFATPDYINESYVNKVRELILACKNIIENKIDISAFNTSEFCVNKLLDISTKSKVDNILYTLRSFTMFYPNLTVSQELVESPLMILTPDTKKRLDMQLLERHAFEYCSNVALIEDYKFNLDDDPSSPDRYKKNLIVDSVNKKFSDETIKDAIIDYFKNSDDLYYICDDVQKTLTENLKRFMTDKKTKRINVPVFLLTTLIPLLNLLCAIVLLFISSMTYEVTTNIVLFGSIILAIVMLCYYAKLLKDEEGITTTQYYLQNGKLTFESLKYILLSTIIAHAVNLLLFNQLFIDGLSSLVSPLTMIQMMVIVGVFMSLLLLCGVLLNKLLDVKVEVLLTVFAILMLIFNLFIRTNFASFEVFESMSVFITALTVFALCYMITTYKGKEILYGMYVLVFVLDYIFCFVTINNVYLKYSLFNDDKIVNHSFVFIAFAIIIISIHSSGLYIYNKNKIKGTDSK